MKKTIVSAVVVGIIIVSIFIFFDRRKHNYQAIPANPINAFDDISKKVQAQVPEWAEAINGMKVDAGVAGARPIAVMVENYPDARPQSGLVDADMVYETVAEGGITRFMAVYQTKDAKNIGPIRSARTYYAELANEIGAVYAHVGGNSDVLYYIKNKLYKNISDADQFFNDAYFHRIATRKAPHNVYSSIPTLKKLETARDMSTAASFTPWKYKDDESVSTVDASHIAIDFSLPDYLVSYAYDSTTNSYKRSMAGKPHTDADSGKQITAKNVIVQYVDVKPVESDTPLSVGINLNSTGKAVVFLDGTAMTGTWKRDNAGRTRYYDKDNKEIILNRGQIWVELVPNDRTVTWK